MAKLEQYSNKMQERINDEVDKCIQDQKNLSAELKFIIEHENNQINLINQNFSRVIEYLQTVRDGLRSELIC